MSKVTNLEIGMIDLSLDDRDRQILQLMRRLRFMRTDQLCRIFFQEPETTDRAKLSRTTRCLHRLEKWGVITHLPRKVRPNRGGTYGLVWHLTETGTRLLDICREIPKRHRPYEPSETFLKHSLAVAEVYTITMETARKEPAFAAKTIEIESEAAREHKTPATYLTPSKTTRICPDMFLEIDNVDESGKKITDYWYIEVDLGTERSKSLMEKCKRYVSYYKTGAPQKEHGVTPAVLFVVPDEQRKATILEVVRKLPDIGWHKCFFLVTEEELLGRLAKGPID